MNKRRQTTVAPPASSIDDDVYVGMDSLTGLYVLSLVVRDLDSIADIAGPAWIEHVTSFAMFLREQLPPLYRGFPIPAVGSQRT